MTCLPRERRDRLAGCVLTGGHALAWALEALLVASLAALLLGRFCPGSYLFLVFTGQGAFANQTLPWSGPHLEA